MTDRLAITKTHKLFIGGSFPRTESGRSLKIVDNSEQVVAHLCRASRKDLRNAVEVAAKAQPGWQKATAYLRGQILYRMAEMMEGKRAELAETISSVTEHGQAEAEVAASIDRLVAFAGWADKHQQVLGCANPVSGPYHNFTFPEPIGVIAAISGDTWPLLELVSLIAPVICTGNAVVALASQSNPIPACIFAEVCATSDVPGGVVNILTGFRDELIEHIAMHRQIGGVLGSAELSSDERTALRLGSAENLKRVAFVSPGEDTGDWLNAELCHSPAWLEPAVEFKTIWHPSAS